MATEMQAQVGTAATADTQQSAGAKRKPGKPKGAQGHKGKMTRSKKPKQPSVRGQSIFALGKAKARRLAWGPIMVASISLTVAACGVCMAVSGIAGFFSPPPPSLELGTMQDGVAMMMDMDMSVDGVDEIMNGDDGVAEMAMEVDDGVQCLTTYQELLRVIDAMTAEEAFSACNEEGLITSCFKF